MSSTPLQAAILDNVGFGSTIHTDQWSGYDGLAVATNIRRLRRSRSQETVSGLVGCSRKHYINMEAGMVDIGLLMLERLADALKVDISELLKSEDKA